MHKKAKDCQKRHGYTLVELVLVMAILLILFGIIYATFSIVNNSHARVAVLNDAKDYAYMNLAYIEKEVANANGIILSQATAAAYYPLAGEVGYKSVYYNSWVLHDGILRTATSASSAAVLFAYAQYTVSTSTGTKAKWEAAPTYSKNLDGTLHIKLEILDNAKSVRTVAYTLEKDFQFLNIKTPSLDIVDNGGGSAAVIKYKNFSY